MFENAFTREGDNHDGARNATRMSHVNNDHLEKYLTRKEML